jgi:hypothetical protein
MPDEIYYALAVALPLIAVIIIVICYFKFQYPKDREREKIRRQKVLEDYEKEPEYKFFHAKVIGARKYVYNKFAWSMPMLPAQVDEYYATFRLETGEEIEYKISEELFFTLTEGEEGTLVTVNGNFFDFGSGEEMSDMNVETLEE